MNIYAEMERRHGTGGLQAGKWEFPLTKVLVCPKESPRQLFTKDTKDTKCIKIQKWPTGNTKKQTKQN